MPFSILHLFLSQLIHHSSTFQTPPSRAHHYRREYRKLCLKVLMKKRKKKIVNTSSGFMLMTTYLEDILFHVRNDELLECIEVLVDAGCRCSVEAQ